MKKFSSHGYTDVIVPLITVIVVIAMVSSLFVITQSETEDMRGQLNTTELGASYIIYQDDGMTCAKNGSTSRIDYKSANASSVIQGAIDSLPSTGGHILIKRGTYLIDTPIMLDNNTAIRGEGHSSRGTSDITVLKAANALPYMLGYPSGVQHRNVAINDLKLDCTQHNVTRAIWLPDTYRAVVENVMTWKAWIGFEIGGGSLLNLELHIRNCHAQGDAVTLRNATGSTGFYLRGTDSEISGCLAGEYYRGFYFGGIGNIFFDMNHASWCGYAGLEIAANTQLVRISNSHFESTQTSAAVVAYRSTQMTFIDNTFFSNQREALRLISCTNISIIGNQFLKNGMYQNNYSSDVVVTGESSAYPSSDLHFVANTFKAHSSIGTKYGIYISAANVMDYTICQNSFNGMVVSGVYSPSGKGGVVSDNTGDKATASYLRGSAVIPAGTNQVTVCHGLTLWPKWVQLTGTSNDTASLYVDALGTVALTIVSTVNVSEDRTVYYEIWC